MADAEMLGAVMAELPATTAWDAAGLGCTLPQCFGIFAALRLNIGGLLRSRFGAELPGVIEAVDWQGFAEEMGLGPVDPAALAADWERGRHEP